MAKKATKKLAKKAGRKVIRKKASWGYAEISWTGIHLGFEGDPTLTSSGRTEQVRSAELAITSFFTTDALTRWTDGKEKYATVVMGEGHMESLARLIEDELNAGLKPSVRKRMHVRRQDIDTPPGEALEPLSARETEETNEFKPNKTMCTYDPKGWIDQLDFGCCIEHVDAASASARAKKAGRTSRARIIPWRPDTIHQILVRFEYDCPYERGLGAVRKGARKAVRKAARKAVR